MPVAPFYGPPPSVSRTVIRVCKASSRRGRDPSRARERRVFAATRFGAQSPLELNTESRPPRPRWHSGPDWRKGSRIWPLVWQNWSRTVAGSRDSGRCGSRGGGRRDRGDKPTCGEWHLRKVSWCFMLSKKDTTDSPSGDRIGQKAQSVPVSKNSHRMISGAAARGSAILPVVSWTRSNLCLDTSRSKRRNGTWAANRNYALPSTTEWASNRTIHRLRSSVCV